MVNNKDKPATVQDIKKLLIDQHTLRVCIKSDEIDKLTTKQDKYFESLARRDEKIYKAFKELQTQIHNLEGSHTRNEARLDKKAALNGERDRQIRELGLKADEDDKTILKMVEKHEERIDLLEAADMGRATQNKIILTLITTLLAAFIIFFIEFQYKTYILHL